MVHSLALRLTGSLCRKRGHLTKVGILIFTLLSILTSAVRVHFTFLDYIMAATETAPWGAVSDVEIARIRCPTEHEGGPSGIAGPN